MKHEINDDIYLKYEYFITSRLLITILYNKNQQ